MCSTLGDFCSVSLWYRFCSSCQGCVEVVACSGLVLVLVPWLVAHLQSGSNVLMLFLSAPTNTYGAVLMVCSHDLYDGGTVDVYLWQWLEFNSWGVICFFLRACSRLRFRGLLYASDFFPWVMWYVAEVHISCEVCGY